MIRAMWPSDSMNSSSSCGTHQAELQAAVQQTGEEVEKSLAETYRQQFRQLGVTQRQVIADLQQLVDDARKEL